MEFLTDLLSSGIRLAVPVALAACGETIAQRSGVLNIGLEGMMTAGAFVGFVAMADLGNPAVAIVGACLAGVAVAALMVLASVWGRANQIVTGLALVVLSAGIVNFLYVQSSAQFVSVPRLGNIAIPGLSAIPLVGEALFTQNVFFYLTVALLAITAGLVARTRLGLETIAVGHDPVVAAAKGVSAVRVRAIATAVAGGFAGLAGAALSLGAIGTYTPGAVGGRGFVAIAVVILGGWRLAWVGAGALLFGLTDALQLRLTNVIDVPVQLLSIIPWVVVLLMLVLSSRYAVMPRSLSTLAQPD